MDAKDMPTYSSSIFCVNTLGNAPIKNNKPEKETHALSVVGQLEAAGNEEDYSGSSGYERSEEDLISNESRTSLKEKLECGLSKMCCSMGTTGQECDMVLTDMKLGGSRGSIFDDLSCISSKLSLREKIIWLESGLEEVRAHLTGREVWVLSKKGHAMKMKCLIRTNELPVCRGQKRPSALRFLKEARDIMVNAGVSSDEWVKIAASRLKGALRIEWDKINDPELYQWDKFAEFLLEIIDAREKEKVKCVKRPVYKRKQTSTEDLSPTKQRITSSQCKES